MTTQAVRVTMIGKNRALHFLLTATDGQWNDLVDNVNSLDIHEVMQGETIDRINGSYTAGACVIRLWNSQTQKVKFIEALPMVKGEHTRMLDRPVKIEKDDILQAYPYAPPT